MSISEKHLSITTARLLDLQKTICSFLLKLNENELDWQQIIENYALITTILKSVVRASSNIGVNAFNSNAIVPTQLSQGHDSSIFEMTGGRISIANDEIIPIILRTKLAAEIESAIEPLSGTSVHLTKKQQEEINTLNEKVSKIQLIYLTYAKTRTDNNRDNIKKGEPKASDQSEKNAKCILAAINYGKL